MSIGKRALLYLRRNKWKCFVLILILTAVLSVLLITLTICKNCKREIRELRQAYGGSFMIEVDYNQLSTVDIETARSTTVDEALISEVMKIDGVSDALRDNCGNYVYCKDMEFVPGAFTAGIENYKENPNQLEYDIEHGIYFPWTPKEALLLAYDRSKLSSYFRTGSFELIEGRHLRADDGDRILISDVLAEKNHLRLGDSITVLLTEAQLNGGDIENVFWEKELEVTGIYHVNTGQIITEYTSEGDILENQLFTTIAIAQDYDKESFKQEIGKELSPRYASAEFFLEDSKKLEEVMEKVREIPGREWEFYKIYPNDTIYQSALDPLQSISNQLLFMMAVVCGACVILLIFIMRMWIGARKKETGVFLALGDDKKKIIGQLLTENLFMLGAALLLALLIATGVGNSIGNYMLSTQNAQKEKREENLKEEIEEFRGSYEGFLALNEQATWKSEVKRPEKITGNLTWQIVVFAVGAVMLVMFAVTLLAARRLLKLKPREILTML